MSKVTLKLDRAAIRALLRSQEVVDGALVPAAKTIAQRAAHTDVYVGKNRANVGVRQDMTSEDMESNSLLKAVH